jgi:stage II sporulation protein D
MKKTQSLLWIFFAMFILVLIIPSILVVPFSSNTKEVIQASTDIKENKNNNSSPEPSIEVSVYRTSAKEIEKIPLEEYVVGVVASEMPSSFELEALKAQALAARTYLIRQMNSDSKLLGVPKNVNADISDNHQFYQVYKNKDELAKQWGENYKSNINKIQNAVNATKGQILTYDRTPIDPSFFSTSNGYTENSEDYWTASLPYLRSVPSPWDKNAPDYIGTKEFTSREFKSKLGTNLTSDISVKRTSTNRVSSITINGRKFSGDEFRKALDLRSTDFSFNIVGDTIQFTTIGYGHGVGMSQYGANGMAKEGKNYQDIVKYYYQNVTISPVEPFLNTTVVKK